MGQVGQSMGLFAYSSPRKRVIAFMFFGGEKQKMWNGMLSDHLTGYLKLNTWFCAHC